MKREPNTVYVLSLSYGKDSLACLDAIQKLGYPLDRIIHAEVWATKDIPADLPPMVEFKRKADEIILQRYGIVVEHFCATKRRERERERERITYSDLFYESHNNEQYGEHINGFPRTLGGWCHRLKYNRETDIRRYILSPCSEAEYGERERERAESTAFPSSKGIGVRATSNNRLCDKVESVLHRGTQKTTPYGFPISVFRGNWCTRLKQQVFE